VDFPKKTLDEDPYRVFIPRSGIHRFEVRGVDGEEVSQSAFNETDFDDTVAAEIDVLGVDVALGSAAATMVETPEQLRQALENQSKLKPVPIGEALMGLGKITPDQLAEALRASARKIPALGQMLIEMGLVTPADLQTAFARSPTAHREAETAKAHRG